MLHPHAIDQSAAFNQIPSLALTAASPSTRLAVERHYRPSTGVTVTLDPIPSKQHVVQRTISYSLYHEGPHSKRLPASLWWLHHKKNRCVPLALKLYSYFKLYESETDDWVKVQSYVPTCMQNIFVLSDLQAYLRLHSLRSLSVHGCWDLQCIKPLLNLEELDIKGVRLSENGFACISNLTNLRVLTLNIDHIPTLQWLAACHKLKELTLMGNASAKSGVETIALLEHLTSLSIRFFFQSSSLDWLAECPKLLQLDIVVADYPYPPILTMPKLTHLQMHHRGNISTRLASTPSVNYSLRLEQVTLSSVRMCNLQWLMYCPLVNVLSVRGCGDATDFSSIGYLGRLAVLDIGNTEIKSIDWIANCVSLIDLNVSNCVNLKDLRPIGTLKNLKILDMENTVDKWQTASSWMPHCAQLEELDASESYIQWSAVSQLKMLRRLSLRRYYTDTQLDVLTQCTRLEELDLTGCCGVSDITPLTRLSRLRCLHVECTSVRLIEPLASCAALEKLYMDAEKVTDLQSISKFPSLSYIHFGVLIAGKFKTIEECLSALPYLRIQMPLSGDFTQLSHVIASYDPLWQSYRHNAKKRKRD